MIRPYRIILFGVFLCLIFTGCSRTNIANNTVSDTQNEPVIESPENQVKVVTLQEMPTLKKGTAIEICWAFSYIRYAGQVYQIALDKIVEKDKLGRQIGKVERFLPASMKVSNELFVDKDGDSNYAAEGSLIYEFKGKDPGEVIIVDDKGVFREATLYNN